MLKTGTFLNTLSVTVMALGMTVGIPQKAFAYDSVLAPAAPTAGSSGTAAPSAEGMYGGVVSAPPTTKNNPYQAAPASNLYDFVANGGSDTPASLEDARRQSADIRKARMQEIQKQNAERVQKQRAEWARMRTEMEKKQQSIMEKARQTGALPYRGGK